MQDEPLAAFGKVAAGISVMPTWMLEFAMSGGVASFGKEATKKSMLKLLSKYAKTKVGATALRAAGWTGGAITRATLGLPAQVAKGATERQLQVTLGMKQEEGWATSFAKAWGDVVIESASEEAGGAITKFGGKLLSKTKLGAKMVDGLSKAWTSTTGGTASQFNKLLNKGGYSNILGEIGEERLGTLLRVITDVDDFGAGEDANMMERLKAGLEQDIAGLPVEAVVLSIPAGGQSIVNRFVGGKPVAKVIEPPAAAPVAKPPAKVAKPGVKPIVPTAKPEEKVVRPTKKQAIIDARKFLDQVKAHEQLVKGEEGIVDVEPIEFEIEKEPSPGLTPQWYEANREVYKKGVLEKSGDFAKGAWKLTEKVITPISTRLFNINPTIFRATRRHVFNVMTRTNEQIKTAETFLQDVKKISAQDRVELDLAFKNSDGIKINELLSKHGLGKEFKNVRVILDELFIAGKKVGLNIDYRKNYMPRMIKDAKGFLDHIRGTDDWPIIEEAIKRQERSRNRQLTEDERAVQRAFPTCTCQASPEAPDARPGVFAE